MSFVVTHPEAPATAAGRLNGVESVIAAANMAALAATTALLPGAADEVSVLAATQFSAHGAACRAVAAQGVAPAATRPLNPPTTSRLTSGGG
jgi:hypothetical protein